MINLFTSYFKHHDPKRQKELDFCLKTNLKNKAINRVIVYDESETLKDHGKLFVPHTTRPTYQDFFKSTEAFPEDINIISNSDIFFDDTILKANQIDDKTCYAITRHEWRNERSLEFQAAHGRGVDPAFSQDVWIFRGAARIQKCDEVLAENSNTKGFDTVKFWMGVGGCDNVIARRIRNAGYILKNPCREIMCNHVHENQNRPKYSHRMTGNRTRWSGLLKVPLTGL